MRNERIPGMRSDSFEWICSKLRVRTYQGLTETFGLPAVAKDENKTKDEPLPVKCKRKMTVGNDDESVRTGHVVVVATSLVGCHDPRQSDLAEVVEPPIGQWTWTWT